MSTTTSATIHNHQFDYIVTLFATPVLTEYFKKLSYKPRVETIFNNIDGNWVLDEQALDKIRKTDKKTLFIVIQEQSITVTNQLIEEAVKQLDGLLDFEVLILSDYAEPKPLDSRIYRITVNAQAKEAYYLRHLEKLFENQPEIFKKILINRGGQKGDTGEYAPVKVEVQGLAAENIVYDQPTEYKFIYDNIAFEVFCRFKLNKPLVVFGQSAITPPVKLPIFHRWSWIEEGDYSALFINDATLYLDEKLEGGWLQGTENHFYMDTYITIIRNFAKLLNISHSQILFFGSSAGGFTSMQMATRLKGSHALVQIPQVDMTTYHLPNVTQKLYTHCYPGLTEEEIKAKYYDRLSVIEAFKKFRYIPNIWYLHNSYDVSHMLTQFGHFMQSVAMLYNDHAELRDNKLVIETYALNHPQRGGHTVMGKEFTLAYINKALKLFVEQDDD